MKYDFQEMSKTLKKYMDKGRYDHTVGVTYTAASLAMAYGENLLSAQIAGLLHDCAKCIPNKKKLKMCAKHEIEVTEIEESNPFLLHAKLGAYLAKEKYDISDEEILSAIRYHTTGREGMTLLEKIVFIADYIEPGRDKAPNLTEVRKAAFNDIDECVYMILRDTLDYLGTNPKTVDITTQKAFRYYETIHNEKGDNHNEQ